MSMFLGALLLHQVSLLEFMRDHMVAYLDDTDKGIRQAAALACCRVLERHAAASVALRRGATPAASGTAAAGALPDPSVGGGGAGAASLGALTPVGASSAAAAAAAAHLAAAGTYLGHQGGLGGAGALGLSVKQAQVVEKVVGKLLLVAVADTSEGVRRAVLKVRPSGREVGEGNAFPAECTAGGCTTSCIIGFAYFRTRMCCDCSPG
jgi:hypothetical protein